ncbi:hypothetical protein H1R20_g1120, partial [Candolleomyces eurysporus]
MKFLKRNKNRLSTNSDEQTAQTSGAQQRQPASHTEYTQSSSAEQQPTTRAPTPKPALAQQQTPHGSMQQMFSGNTGFTFNGPMTFNNNGNSTNVTNLNPIERACEQPANHSRAPNYGTGGRNLNALVPDIDPEGYASFKRSSAQYYRAIGLPYLADVLMYDPNTSSTYGNYQ